MASTGLDETDRLILSALREQARLPFSALARKVGLSTTACKHRIHRLERLSHISGYTLREPPKAQMMGVTKFILIPIVRTSAAIMVDVAKCLERHKSISWAGIIEGDYTFIARVDEQEGDETRIIMRDLSSIDALGKTMTFTVTEVVVPSRKALRSSD